MFKKIAYFLIIVFAGSITHASPLVKINSVNTDSDRIVIGYKINDSTTNITIKNYAIQQLIISPISNLVRTHITSEPATILLTKHKPYLKFSISDSLGKKITIAIELKEKSNGLYVFNYKKGIEFFVAYPTGSCTSCEFVTDKNKIVGTKCNGQYFSPGGQTPQATVLFLSKTIE